MNKKSLSFIAGLMAFTLGLGFFFLAPSTTANAVISGCDHLDLGPHLSDGVNHMFYTDEFKYFDAGDVISWDMYSGVADGHNSQVLVSINNGSTNVVYDNITGDVAQDTGSYEILTSGNYRVQIYAHEGPAFTATGTSTLGGIVTCGSLTPPVVNTDPVEEAGTLVVNTDGRLNFQMADVNAVLYPAQDDAGNPTMQVYCTTADATGFLGLVISQVDLPEVAPAENTLVAAGDVCNVEFWALADGSQFRYQVNIGPSIDGTIFELLFNNIGGEDMQMRSFNQYEMSN